MTVAICIKCGSFKFGAFCTCEICSAHPETEDELALSLIMTDHFHSRQALEHFGKSIASGSELQIDPATKDALKVFLEMRQASATLKRMNSRSKGEE